MWGRNMQITTKQDLEFTKKAYKISYEMQSAEFKHDFRHIVFHNRLTDEQKIMSLKMLLGEE